MRSLFAPRPSPYYIYGFNYRRSSAGIRVMHMLCDALIRSGHEAYILAEVFSPDLMTPRLTDQVLAQHRAQGIRPIAVYPEVIDGNPLQGGVVVRYLLNKPGFIGGTGAYGEDDLFFAYKQDFMLEGMEQRQCLFLPAIDSNIFRPAEASLRRPGSVCYYLGHKRQARLDPDLLPADAIEITLSYPDSWEELASIFQRCEFLYLGEASGLAYEAALCGCTPVLVSGAWSSIRSDASSFVAFGMTASEVARARSVIPDVQALLEQHRTDFWPQLDHFIQVTQAAAEQSRREAHGSIDRVALDGLRLTRMAGSQDTSHYRDDMVVQQPVEADQAFPPLGVVIHVDDVALFEELLLTLETLEQPLQLYVSCHDRSIVPVVQALQASALRYSLMRVPRRGWDVLPLRRVLPLLQSDGIQVMLKLHTCVAAKGMSVQDLRHRIASLVYSEGTRRAVERLQQAEVHILGSPLGETRLSVAQTVGASRAQLLSLGSRAGLSEGHLLTANFIPDGLFYARVSAFDCLADLHLEDSEFESDNTGYECSFTRAVEILFSVLIEARNGSDIARSYGKWLARRTFAPEHHALLQRRIETWETPPSLLVVILDPAGDLPAVRRTLLSLSHQFYGAAAIVVYSSTQPQGIPPADNLLWQGMTPDVWTRLDDVLAQIEVDWLYLLGAGDELEPQSLLLLAERIVAYPRLRVCYSDEDSTVNGIRQSPVFKPDFNLDLLRSYPYLGGTLAFERQALLSGGGFMGRFAGLSPVDALLRVLERDGVGAVGHLPEILVHKDESLGSWLIRADVAPQIAPVIREHLRRLGIAHELQTGAISLINRVVYHHPTQPLVSIVIPTKDQLPMVQRCVLSLLKMTRYPNYEVIIVDNDSETAEALAWLEGVSNLAPQRIRVLRYPHPFNYSAINNAAVAQAQGEYLVLLNNDTEITRSDWLDALLNHAQRPEVGIVGAKLLYPDGRVQHAGVVLGLRGPADHPFVGEPGNAPGYMHRLLVDQNYSAVTAACLMIRKAVYLEVGGMDEERFKVSYNDVDLCLKVGAAGYLTVWTPYAVLLHEGSVSQNRVDTTAIDAKVARFRGEQERLYETWLAKIARDPAYNKNLVLEGQGFAFSSSSSTPWYPFVQRQVPYVLAHHADPYGCGHYRILKPFQALEAAGLIEGAATEMLLTPVEFERLSPDIAVFQRQLSPLQCEVIRDAGRFSKAFKVYELDDYLLDLPSKSVHRGHMPRDIAEQLPKAIGLCDRLVVSTLPLAEALGHMHAEVKVMENFLPVDWWGDLQSARRVGRKPRVGWAGGSGHAGDLELLIEVVAALADEVEWVFLGMSLPELRPYLQEFHPGVSIEDYPRKLASLNLDLALAPLENNLFNACKSNLRLLEYGACGFPVVCSDLECYRGALPVTRVANRTSAWLEAIRSHLADLDETARLGDALRIAVHEGWLLQGGNLDRWRTAWLPG